MRLTGYSDRSPAMHPEFDWDSPNLIEYVIDTDPYIEKYECCEYTGNDRARINIIIKEDRLEECRNLLK